MLNFVAEEEEGRLVEGAYDCAVGGLMRLAMEGDALALLLVLTGEVCAGVAGLEICIGRGTSIVEERIGS